MNQTAREQRLLTREARRSLFLHRVLAQHVALRPEESFARARATLQRMEAAHSGTSPFLRLWKALLAESPDRVIARMTGLDDEACELRQVTPFAGLLSAGERSEIYRRFAEAEHAPEARCVRARGPRCRRDPRRF
jgi:hypothetical protein